MDGLKGINISGDRTNSFMIFYYGDFIYRILWDFLGFHGILRGLISGSMWILMGEDLCGFNQQQWGIHIGIELGIY